MGKVRSLSPTGARSRRTNHNNVRRRSPLRKNTTRRPRKIWRNEGDHLMEAIFPEESFDGSLLGESNPLEEEVKSNNANGDGS